MYRVFKRFKLPIGHRLSKHGGRCYNFHGHNFVVEIQLSSEELNSNDMVIDFHDLKRVVNDQIDKYDHATILNPTDIVNIENYKTLGYRLEFINAGGEDVDPTAETLSKFLYHKFSDVFKKEYSINVDFIRIWESDDSMAEYSE